MMDPLRWSILGVLSAGALIASRHAWRARQAYGLYRFLAFEMLAVLIAWNADRWFQEWRSPRQVVSWILFVISGGLAAHGTLLLRRVGGSRSRIMEDTRTVVRVGAYRYIRHPLYGALGLFGWGVFPKEVDVVSGFLGVAATLLLVATARSEERFNVTILGPEYAEYMRETKMFLPFLV